MIDEQRPAPASDKPTASPATDEEIAENGDWAPCDCRLYEDDPCRNRPDCSQVFLPRLHARITSDADLLRTQAETIQAQASQIKRCHGIMQGLVSIHDPSETNADVLDDAEKELGGEFCPGQCTSACDAQLASARARADKAEAEVERLREALQHQTLRNHQYLPRGCNGCESADAALAPASDPTK